MVSGDVCGPSGETKSRHAVKRDGSLFENAAGWRSAALLIPCDDSRCRFRQVNLITYFFQTSGENFDFVLLLCQRGLQFDDCPLLFLYFAVLFNNSDAPKSPRLVQDQI